MTSRLALGVLLFVVMHIMVWVSTNTQFMKSMQHINTLSIALVLSLPITLCAFYGSRYTYNALHESAWSARFMGFGVSYLVFPVMTWALLDESMFTRKTLVCILLSILIVCTQVFME